MFIKNGFVTILFNFSTVGTWNNGTAYYPYTLLQPLKNLIGTSAIYTTLHTSSGIFTECKIDLGSDSRIRVTPRGSNISAGAHIRGSATFPIILN